MNQNKDHRPNDVLKYSGMAFEMVFIIGLGLLIGHFLDRGFAFKKPILTLLFGILFLAAYFYKLVKNLSKK